MRKIILGLSFMGLAACGQSGDHAAMPSGENMSGGIAVSNAWVRTPLPGRDMTAAYFTLDNNSGAADKLIGVSTDVSARAEIHTHLNVEGVMKMRKLDGLEIAKSETVTFKQGGLHVMMFETEIAQGDGDVEITLSFEKGGNVTVTANIQDKPSEMTMDHSGH